jgi:hypothetical protein
MEKAVRPVAVASFGNSSAISERNDASKRSQLKRGDTSSIQYLKATVLRMGSLEEQVWSCPLPQLNPLASPHPATRLHNSYSAKAQHHNAHCMHCARRNLLLQTRLRS